MADIIKEESKNIVEVRDLAVSFDTYGGSVKAVRGVSYDIRRAECLAIVGESGCGKSVTSQAIMRLLTTPPAHISGSVKFDGEEVLTLPEKKMRELRGSKMAMIFQDPMTSLNPTMQIGKQIMEGIRQHQKVSKKEAADRAVEVLRLVRIPNPESQLKRYPYQLSGGMRQRVVIAMALVCNPALLIADEPTTALDVTTQAQILDLIRGLKKELNTAVVLITHDMGVVSNMAERIAVFYAGKIMEIGSAEDVFYHFAHPYTAALLRSRPRLDRDRTQKLVSITGTPPDLFSPPVGCAFAARCNYAMEICLKKQPEMFQSGKSGEHCACCWLHHPDASKMYAEFRTEAGGSDE